MEINKNKIERIDADKNSMAFGDCYICKIATQVYTCQAHFDNFSGWYEIDLCTDCLLKELQT
jgi:hypothetical protein